MTGSGKIHALENDPVGRIRERVARGRVLEADDGDDVAGEGLVDLLAAVGVHLEHAADALALLLDRVLEHRAGFDVARIDAAEGQRAHVRVVGDLEREHRQRLVVGRVALDLGLGLDVDALDRRNVGRRRQEVDDAIEQRLHALVLEGRATEHREELAVDRALADQPAERRVVRHVAVEVSLGRGVIDFDGRSRPSARGT